MIDYIGRKCPFCENPIEESEEIVICNKCKTVHHLVCWNANRGCTTYSCDGNMIYLDGKEIPEELNDSSEISNSSTSVESEPEKTKHCPECNELVSDLDVVCFNCGYPLIDDDVEFKINKKTAKKQLQTERKKNRGYFLIPATIILLFLAFVTGYYYYHYYSAILFANNHQFSIALKKVDKMPAIRLLDEDLVTYINSGILIEEGKYKEAALAFISMGDYRNSRNIAKECSLIYANELDQNQQYEAELEWIKSMQDEGLTYPNYMVPIIEWRIKNGNKEFSVIEDIPEEKSYLSNMNFEVGYMYHYDTISNPSTIYIVLDYNNQEFLAFEVLDDTSEVYYISYGLITGSLDDLLILTVLYDFVDGEYYNIYMKPANKSIDYTDYTNVLVSTDYFNLDNGANYSIVYWGQFKEYLP